MSRDPVRGGALGDGMLLPGSPLANRIGFTHEAFGDGSYLWVDPARVLVSFIAANHPGRGDFSRLVKSIEGLGYRVAVPTPMGQMQSILSRWGFEPHMEHDPDMGAVEVWERKVRP